MCDCGGLDHIGAFCSGRGIARIIAYLATQDPPLFQNSRLRPVIGETDLESINSTFVDAVDHHDGLAAEILASVTLPIAELLLQIFTIDPLVHHVALTGGIVHAVGEPYKATVSHHLQRLGLYQISSRDQQVFDRRIRVAEPADRLAILGAGISRTICRASLQRRRGGAAVAGPRDEGQRLHGQKETKILSIENAALSEILASTRCLVVCDLGFDTHYGDTARNYFRHFGIEAPWLALETRDLGKDGALLDRIVGHFNQLRLARRGDAVVAFGGGVLLDTVGFAGFDLSERRGLSPRADDPDRAHRCRNWVQGRDRQAIQKSHWFVLSAPQVTFGLYVPKDAPGASSPQWRSRDREAGHCCRR